MAGQDLRALKSCLTDYVNSITTHSGKLYNCPLCGSGTGKNHTGAFSIYANGERCKCFACGFGDTDAGDTAKDIFDLCAAYEKVSLPEATKMIIERYGSPATAQRTTAAEDFADVAPAPMAANAAPDQKPEQQPRKDYTEYLTRCAEAMPGSPAESYLRDRGFTDETIKRFRLGYDAGCYNKQLGRRIPSITIPYGIKADGRMTYYATRAISEKAYDKPKTIEAGSEPLFNAAALYAGDVVFVVESQLCAISIEQAGGKAIAVGGKGASKLTDQLKRKPSAAALVLCLDNDDAGRTATAAMDKALEALGVFHADGSAAIMGEYEQGSAEYCKDPNEVLQRRGNEALTAAVKETVDGTIYARDFAAQFEEEERQKRTGAGMVDSFLADIQTERYKPLPTGITDIDRALSGGLFRQTLVVLGAAPGAGKTALAQWIFEGMAKNGTNCLYLNLEMSREQILARSFSRIAARQGFKINANAVMKGYAWTAEQRAAVMAAADEYKRDIAPRMVYNGIDSNDLDAIIDHIEAEAQRAEKAGMQAPIVCIDYLQLIGGRPGEDAAAVLKRAVSAFKGYAIKHETIVFTIIAHNRASNSTGAVSMESGRDTSAIEYSADLQLALAFTDCIKKPGSKDKAKTPDELTPEDMKRVTLRIVKGRFGGRGTDVDLHFNGETMTYTQTAHEFSEYKGATPFDKPANGKAQQMHF